jgi:hypothetical protein
MSVQDYDKLAWGLVKDEIRRLIKPRSEGILHDTIFDIFWPNGKSLYEGKTGLSDTRLKKVKANISSQLKARLNSFNHQTVRGRMDENGPVLDVNSSFVWDFKEMSCSDSKEFQGERFEKFLELQNINYAVGKRKFYIDVISSHIIVNQHTLYRMLQRGAVSRDPIKLLTNSLPDWGRYTTLFMLCGKYFPSYKGSNVLIPFNGGALLGKIGFTKYAISAEGWNQQCIRFFNSITHGDIRTAPCDSALSHVMDGDPGHITLQIATWISDEMFRDEQAWAHRRIQEFAIKHQRVLEVSENLIYRRLALPKDKKTGVSVSEFTSFKDDLREIYLDPRWTIACKWS